MNERTSIFRKYATSILVTAMLMLAAAVQAQTDKLDTLLYVKTTGSHTNNGLSWANAKSDLQDAINVLHQYLKDNNLKSGSIYVAAGTYKPSESTESSGGGLQYTSFIIYEGIHIYGGFPEDITDENANHYEKDANGNYVYRPLDNSLQSLESGQEAKLQPWNFQHKTILSGSHNAEPTFTFDQERGTYSTVFPGNSYHVVWFATNGFVSGTDEDETMHGLPLNQPASIDGCTITGGNAANKTTLPRNHTSYGGGAYMVSNSELTNCVVEKCAATMRGGGVYLDGGGKVDNCFINTCQATGVGIMQGYGGGVCIDYDGAVTRSYIVNNSSRIGGGLAICHAPDDYPWEELDTWRTTNGQATRGEINIYSPHATACIVSHNTSTAEGGGVYLYEGGVVNHMTIVRNKCVGADVTYYGRRHGRAGGIYILNGGHIYNSVIWGNECPANNDIQYAAHTSGSTDEKKPQVSYTAVAKHDITDWAGTTKRNVMSLESTNTNEPKNNANYPYFIGTDGKGTLQNVWGAGLSQIPRPIYWKPAAISSLGEQGVQVTDALSVTSEWIRHAHALTDLFGQHYEPRSSLGAVIRRDEQITCATTVKNQEIELYREKGYTQGDVNTYASAAAATAQQETFLTTLLPDDGTNATIPTIFVDPTRNPGQKEISIGETGIGATWDKPVAHINDAIDYFRQHLQKDDSDNFYYDINDTHYDYVQILVKGGDGVVTTTAGRGAYLGEELRTAAIRPLPNMRLYGGYPLSNSGTSVTGRNPRTHHTTISANVTNSTYDNNAAHVFALINVKNVIIDGFRLYYGNANLNEEHSYSSSPIAYGGGLILNNATTAQEDRIDMTGNILRNSVIANCSAPNGAAIYVNSEYAKHGNGDYCKAELNVVNTIIRNNTVGDGSDVLEKNADAGIITAHGPNAKIRLDHCNIVNNSGYALETLSKNEGENYSTSTSANPNEGQIRIYNSIIYANGSRVWDNRKDIKLPLSCRSSSFSQMNVDGDYIFLDWDAPKPKNPEHCFAILCRDFSDEYHKWGVRLKDQYQQTVYIDNVSTAQFFDSEEAALQFIQSQSSGENWSTPVYLDYPYFENPSKNVGHSAEGDKPMNGGVVSYMPTNMNPLVNGAVSASTNLWDQAGNKRYYGGAPDAGALEDTSLPEAGKVKYVRTPADGGNDNNDGNSWATAYATITHALNQSTANAGNEIWVAAGTYTENLNMKEGVNVYGGFYPKGNPGKELKDGERNIGNNNPDYQTIVDGNSSGRVLSQLDNYATPTVWEGFTFQHGSLHSANQVTRLTTINKNTNTVTKETYIKSEADSWGGTYSSVREDCNSDAEGVVGYYTKEVDATSSDYTKINIIPATKADHDDFTTNSIDRDTWITNVTGDANRRNANNSANATNDGYWAETATEQGTNATYDYVYNSVPVDRSTWTAIVPLEDRRGANSQANAYSASNQKWWGTGETNGSTSDFDWTTSINYSTWNSNSSNPETYQREYETGITASDIYNGGLQNQNSWKNATSEANATQGSDGWYYWHTGTATTSNSSSYDYSESRWFSTTYYSYPNRYRARYTKYSQYANYNREGHYKYANYYKNEYTKNEYKKDVQQYYRIKYTATVTTTTYTKGVQTTYTDNRRGGGVRLFYNGVLKNCLIRDNTLNLESPKLTGNTYGGAGADLNPGSQIESCVIRNNRIISGGVASACGAYVDDAVFINSMVVENYNTGGTNMTGAALFVTDKVSRFYNCTFAYNHGYGTAAAVGGIWHCGASGKNPSAFYNCIFWGNAGNGLTGENFVQIGRGSWADHVGDTGVMFNCYHSAPNANFANEGVTGNKGSRTVSDLSLVHVTGTSANSWSGTTCNKLTALNNYYLLYRNALRDANLFNESQYPLIEETNGTLENGETRYTTKTTASDNASWRTNNPYSINPACDLAKYCVNMGSDTYGSVLSNDYGITIDIAGADRTQDCQIDKGAYEYDGTKEIKPGYEMISFDPENPNTRELCAVYYVSGGGTGLATGDSPLNAACANKLQKVLDAAGRLKADLALGRREYSTSSVQVTGNVRPTYEILSGANNIVRTDYTEDVNLSQTKHVIVKLAAGIYYPLRTTDHNVLDGKSEEIITDRSLMIPHGVELMGGYVASTDNNVAFTEAWRNIPEHQTILSGEVSNEQTGASGNAYHVVTFTNTIYADDNKSRLSNDGLSTITDRAVVDGVIIQNGYANGTTDESKAGPAAIVTDFAHVRNSTIKDNRAVSNGGGLYLKPGALVSGCILLNNQAELGGAIYVEEPTEAEVAEEEQASGNRDKLYARVYNTTIVRNNAGTRGGGVWFESNIRAKGVVLWQNSSNDMNNVAGSFDPNEEQNEQNFPFAYSAVQARRLPGVNNVEVQAQANNGVRWATNSTDNMLWRGDTISYVGQSRTDAYYYLDRLSYLVRTGMPYTLYMSLRTQYPSLELRDMAGVARMTEHYSSEEPSYLKTMTFTPVAKDNGTLEIGARALNDQMGFELSRPFTRLFVASPDQVDMEKATALLDSGDPLYSLQGSSFANPFQKFTDALDYIATLRNTETIGEIYADTRFEIYVAGGTYYPLHNARGQEGHARSSTFLVPEGVTIVGGLDPSNLYCQKGYDFESNQPTAGNDRLNYHNDYQGNDRTQVTNASGTNQTLSFTLVAADINKIMEDREREDINGNNVYEPWEFARTTTFSGSTPHGQENEGNVYHVITCMADPEHVGRLPKRYTTAGTTPYNIFSGEITSDADASNECQASELHRTIIINGVNVTNGNARDYEAASIKNVTQYYRGGGILVDGNWRDADLDSGQELNGESEPVYIEGYDSPEYKRDVARPALRNIPLIIANSQFQNNNAIQGGAIFTNGSLLTFGCSFVQNYSQGPTVNKLSGESHNAARDAMQFSGGGAIATNGMLRCANTLFANNEAMLGDWESHMWTGDDNWDNVLGDNSSGKTQAYGWKEQGFGGAVWGSRFANVRFTNCNFVMNQAVSYPCVFVNGYSESVENKFAANTVFWGNAITGVTNQDFQGKGIDDINQDVFSYRSNTEKEEMIRLAAEKEAGTITPDDNTTLEALRQRQPMFFCAYRPGFGPDVISSPIKQNANGTYDNKIHLTGYTSWRIPAPDGDYTPNELPFLGEDKEINYYTLFGNANNNVNLTFENNGVDGPNFILPSNTPGKDGYNAAANWMSSRVNKLTDNGWSYLILTKQANGDVEFAKINDQKPETQYPDNQVSGGPYNFYSYTLGSSYKLSFMPYGDDYYMRFKNSALTDAESNMLRISSNPLTLERAPAYIDIGMYEYQHRNLKINVSSDIDIIWVSDEENTDLGNDGYTWETPTSNLQAAIETLLKSRNNHHKQVNIIGGEYKPMATLGDDKNFSLSFTIHTQLYNDGSFTPSTGQDYGILSFTMRGGYDKEVPNEAGYNMDKNQVILSVDPRTSTTPDQMNHIVNILNAEQYTTMVSGSDDNYNRNNLAKGRVIPITFEGITFENQRAGAITEGSGQNTNKGGAAIYYRAQHPKNESDEYDETRLLLPPAKYTKEAGDNPEVDWDWENSSGEPKLTIRNCIFKNNGQEVENPTSAVKIEGGGGSALIVNSLFHHNAGNPVDAINTTVLNSTFGLNKGHLKLTESTENGTTYYSALHNSIIWKDDQANGATATSPGTQYAGVTAMTYNAITGLGDEADAQHNYGLSDTNNDVLKGPNFADPENGDFHLKPSKKIMNQGNNGVYASFVWPKYSQQTDYENLMRNKHGDQSRTEAYTTTIVNGNSTTTINYHKLVANKDYALGYTERLLSTNIDRGAYECTNNGQRVIYMNPNKTALGTETGRTWQEAFGQGNLQTAIDAATIYGGEGMAYVFVKGQNNSTNSEEAITMRNGVNVFGGIGTDNIQAVPKNSNDEVLEYTEEELEAFVNRVKSTRTGMAASNAMPTRIKGIATVEGDYDKGAVVDGFLVSNGATEAQPATTAAVKIGVGNVAMRNSIVTGNIMNSGTPVVSLANTSGKSLLYNTLVYGNKAGTLLNVGSNSYVLNCTVVADNEGETPIAGEGNNTTNVQNTIGVNESAGKGAMFAPYQRPNANVYVPADYLTNYRPYWYQLHEESTDINGGNDDGSTAKTGGNTIAAAFPSYVNFDHDLDLLGNPRRLGGRVDNGCFETWKIADNDKVYATNETNAKASDNKYVAEVESNHNTFSEATMEPKGEYWTENYGGNLYPHQGSVVYIGKNAVLSVKRADGQPLFNQAKNIRPGYLLVKEGGSLYGNGNHIQAAYVAAEHTIAGDYDLMALPFAYDIANAYTTGNNAAQTSCELTATEGYTYNGVARSAWRYRFKAEDSECWQQLSNTQIEANEGWLVDLSSKTDLQNQPLRFTGWGANNSTYAYEEDGNSKTVMLQQHDDRTSTSGGADFTKQENMGWNLKGMPWLVSSYETSTKDDVDGTYQMNVPHVFYSTLDASNDTYGQFYTARSWDPGSTLTLGHAFFTQTAAIADEEPLVFKQPIYSETTVAPARKRIAISRDSESSNDDAVDVYPQTDASADMTFNMGADGVKWMAFDERLAQIYVENGEGTRLSLVSAAPVETDIDLGVAVPAEGDYVISLPEPEAYDDYEAVWVIDKLTGAVANLKDEHFTLSTAQAGDISGRLKLRFGGMRPDGRTESNVQNILKRTARKGRLPLGDLNADEQIKVYTASGSLVYSGTVSGSQNTFMLDGVYIIKRQ